MPKTFGLICHIPKRSNPDGQCSPTQKKRILQVLKEAIGTGIVHTPCKRLDLSIAKLTPWPPDCSILLTVLLNFLNRPLLGNQEPTINNRVMDQCKDVGRCFAFQKHGFPMGTLVRKVSQILIVLIITLHCYIMQPFKAGKVRTLTGMTQHFALLLYWPVISDSDLLWDVNQALVKCTFYSPCLICDAFAFLTGMSALTICDQHTGWSRIRTNIFVN